MWTDAGDARVCKFCMTLAASWNASLDTPITDAEANEALDRASRDDFLKAIERDQTVADDAILKAAERSQGGILREMNIGGQQYAPAAGESLTVQVERAITERRAQIRSQAAIPQGTDIGFGPAPDAVDFEIVDGGRKAAKYISVPVAVGTGYEVIRRRGDYLIIDENGKVVDKGSSLSLLLLIFALLEKKRRDDAAEREAQDG